MDSGIPQSLLTTMGEIVFNDITGDASETAELLAGDLGVLPRKVWPGPGVHPDYPLGLPPGNGYQMQFVSGMHGSTVRAQVDNRPHKAGGIVHKFYAGPKYFTLDGLIIGDDPTIRAVLYDMLAGWVFSSMQADARYFFKQPGQTTRFKTCRSYDSTEILGPQGSPGGSPSGIAAPKQYVLQFVAVNPFSYTYTERDTVIAGGASAFIPNDGTVETWPVIEVFCIANGAGASFTVSNGIFDVEWAGALASGDHIEVNMFNETMYRNGNSTNKLPGLNDQSDFWSIPPGGCTVSATPGADHIVVKSNDAWI